MFRNFTTESRQINIILPVFASVWISDNTLHLLLSRLLVPVLANEKLSLFDHCFLQIHNQHFQQQLFIKYCLCCPFLSHVLQLCLAHVSFSSVRLILRFDQFVLSCSVGDGCFEHSVFRHTVCSRSSWRPYLWPDSLFSIDLACCWPLSRPLKTWTNKDYNIFFGL